MTNNITHFVMDLGKVLLGRSPNDAVKAGERARRTGPAIAGFIAGCGLGAGCQAVAGLWSLMLPTYLSLMALAMALAADFGGAQSRALTLRLVAETRPQPVESQRASPSGTTSNAGRS
jgi:uncharacterized membrane protein YoaK (UPF0700 family)